MSDNSNSPLLLTTARFVNRQVNGGPKCSKVLAHTGPLTQFRYGTDTPSTWAHRDGDGPQQIAVICTPQSGLIVIDVDDPELFATTSTARLVSVADAWCTRGAGFHIPVDARHIPHERWPRQGPIPGGDIKSNGWVPMPGSLHYGGQEYRPC